MPLDTEWRHDCPDCAPVRWIVNATHESVCFEAIRQLRNVRTHALEAACQLAQGQRFASPDKGVERLILCAGKPNRLEGRFQTLLN